MLRLPAPGILLADRRDKPALVPYHFPMRGLLETRSLQKQFGNGAGVQDLHLEIPQGEGFSLLGPSGCGKSTTLRLISGLETPDQGKILHAGKDITRLPPQKRDIRTVFQRYALFPHLSVAENICFGLRMQKIPAQEIKKKLHWALELLEVTKLLGRPVQKLSGGEQQRIALARALVTEPSVLLLDEPLSALDLKLREKMQMELLQLRHKLGSTFIFVTHDQCEAMAVSDRIAVMRGGRIEQTGSPEEIYHRPKTRFVAEFIGQANFLGPGAAVKGDKEKLPTLSRGHEWMVRPEHLTPRALSWNPPQGFAALEAEILETAFLGVDRITKARDSQNATYLMKTPGFEPAPGRPQEKILLSWETEDTWTVASS
jgi:spermidine/putrescine transport system ATP-binding protein